MKLLIDIGNTRSKWALRDAGGWLSEGSVAHGGEPERALPPPAAVGSVWIAQVFGPEYESRLSLAVAARFGVPPRILRTPPRQLGLINAYAEPGRLGIDRWLMMLALWREGRAPFCVVGAGTALTLDGVDASGRHLGGFIAAGVATHREAVLGATRFTTREFADELDAGLGRDTESCVRQGAVLASLGAIERGRAACGSPAHCYLAGGDAERLQALLGGDWTLRPRLVLEGLDAAAADVA
jgi:type III pantothenate kinase